MNETVSNNPHNQDNSIPYTLWSATLLDLLIDALRKELPDDQIIPSIRALHKRHFSATYLVRKTRQRLNEQSADRLLDLIRRLQSGN
ncbi:MAG: hypothetical protein OQL16_09340 [Gammaproteobacteria bacterium]|nr:hypothetical protein [Gammaproteobacteria bacterium]